MKHVFYLKYPYRVGDFDVSIDLMRNFSIEDIEKIWSVEFVYDNGKTYKYYEDLKWWEIAADNPVYVEFIGVDGRTSINLPPVRNGKPLKINTIYCFICNENENIYTSRFEDRIISAYIKEMK